eukprot:GEMP01061149.1.p1 GENE.GEMP01061149.1~~GEMP01061149.1.p1  ORF type:complete len:180 (+),score=27.71 GEMP01061149.1:59-598(+)
MGGCTPSRDYCCNAELEQLTSTVILEGAPAPLPRDDEILKEYRPDRGGIEPAELMPRSALSVKHDADRESSSSKGPVASARIVAFAGSDLSGSPAIQYYSASAATIISENRSSVATQLTGQTVRRVTVWETKTRPTDYLYVDLANEVGMHDLPASPGRRRKSGYTRPELDSALTQDSAS